MSGRILLVDDERAIRRILSALLTDAGYELLALESGEAALERAPEFRPDVALLDLKLGGLSGIETMKKLQTALPDSPPAFVIMTAHGTIRSAVEAMRQGAADYITKPFDNEELQIVIQRVLGVRALERRVVVLESQLEERFRPENMIGLSGAMHAVFQRIARIAAADTTVLITGETGTGKELVARATHRQSKRGDKPFVAINCGAIPPTLMESTFFGHVRGAFTDAKVARRGAFEEAEGGTLFLDEVGELPPAAQAGLLRAVQEGEIRRVGDDKPIAVDVRVIAATHRDLEAEVAAGRFREDLYWRLNVLPIHLPPLRERPEDIPALIDHFVAKYAASSGIPARSPTPDALALLMGYEWPGNVRELENAVESALVLATGPDIRAADLPARIHLHSDDADDARRSGGPAGSLSDAVDRTRAALEERMIRAALKDAGGSRTLAAEALGVSRKTLFNKMRELGIR